MPPIKHVRFFAEVTLEDGRIGHATGEVDGCLLNLSAMPLEDFLKREMEPYMASLARFLEEAE